MGRLKKEINTKQNPADYWNQRFSNEGKIWGHKPSSTAIYALDLFQKYHIKKIFIPGAGYGRNSKLFSNHNFDVVGMEISEIAYNIAKTYDNKTKFILGSILDIPLNEEFYDAIYCYNTLHLFLREDRIKFLRNCYIQLKPNGFIYFVVFSDKEQSFGKGKQIEENTYESKPGRPTHYFTEEDIIEHFKDYSIIETGIVEDQENHGESGFHTHTLRYIFAQKKQKIQC